MEFDFFIVLFLSWLFSLHGDFYGHVVSGHEWSSRVGARRTKSSVESAALERAQWIQLGERRRGEAAVRRAKTHLRRKDAIVGFRLAQSLGRGSGERVVKSRAQVGNVERWL